MNRTRTLVGLTLLPLLGCALSSCALEKTDRPAKSAPFPGLIAPGVPGAPGEPGAQGAPGEPGDPALAALLKEARAMQPFVRIAWVRRFLDATAALPAIPERRLFGDAAKAHWFREDQLAALPPAEREALLERPLDSDFYYNTRYGTPLAYARPFDLLGIENFAPDGAKIADFGFGGIGQLRLLASLGADVTGIEVDPLTRVLYNFPGDQGPVARFAGAARDGSVRLVYGRFPFEEPVATAVGGGYDLFISKNTLKRGYIHPEKPVPDRQRIDLGVSDEAFVRTLHDMLRPAGFVMIYNICPAPAPADEPYIPWADGRSPFARELFEAAGFDVIAFDRDDSQAARTMAHALGWDAPVDTENGREPGMDLEHDLFATYTLARRTQ